MQEYISRVLRVLMVFVFLLAIFFLVAAALSVFYSQAALALGWFFGPLMLCFLPLLAYLYIQNKGGARWERPRSLDR